MKLPLIILLTLALAVAVGAETIEQGRERLVGLFTGELASKHKFGRLEPFEKPAIKRDGEKVNLGFDGFLVTVAPGGSLLTAKEIAERRADNAKQREELKKLAIEEGEAFLGSLLADMFANDDSDFPEIGLRAQAFDFMGQKLTFTTSDGRFDVHIEDAEPYSIQLVPFCRDISDAYDQDLKAAEDPVARNCSRFANIVIPVIDMEDEPVESAFAFINQRWLETDPHVKGFDFELSQPDRFAGKQLTLKARNLKVHELAGLIAAQLDATITIGTEAIEFAPREITEK